jgi:toxin ParE1/3/4
LIIEWSLFAIEYRTRIFDYIEQDNPMAAIAVDERIMEQTAKLARFPESGKTTSCFLINLMSNSVINP